MLRIGGDYKLSIFGLCWGAREECPNLFWAKGKRRCAFENDAIERMKEEKHLGVFAKLPR